MSEDLESPRALAPGELLFEAPVRRRKPPRHLADLTTAQRREVVEELGLPGFRADQVSRQYFTRLVRDPQEWTDVPAAARQQLADALTPSMMSLVREVTCDNGMTRKTLWRLHDGVLVESVLMRYPDRVTMCVSSQVGCGMNCPFCATGQSGLTRNLSTAEIVDQVVAGAAELARGDVPGGVGRVSNVVFMGMGEPLLNYANVITAIDRITSPKGLGMAMKRITVSTAGIAKMIEKMADDGVKFNLAVSLHSAIDRKRSTLMPINETNSLETLGEALKYWYQKTKSKVTYEYVVWKGINDTEADVQALLKFCKLIPCKVNLIEYNNIGDEGFSQASPEIVNRYMDVLEQHGITTRVRRSRGKDIDAACGQLANKF